MEIELLNKINSESAEMCRCKCGSGDCCDRWLDGFWAFIIYQMKNKQIKTKRTAN